MFDLAYDEQLAAAYDYRHFGGPSGEAILAKDLEAVLKLLPTAPARILDIPCGTGIYTERLIRCGYRVAAADASESMLTVARMRPTDTETRLCSIFSLPFGESSFDATVTLRLFSHFEPRQIVSSLSELGRVIKPGGRVVFDTFRWTPRRWPLLRRFVEQGCIYEMAVSEATQLVRDSGLRVVATETRYLFSPIWQRKLTLRLLKALTAVESRLPHSWLLRTFWACTKDE